MGVPSLIGFTVEAMFYGWKAEQFPMPTWRSWRSSGTRSCAVKSGVGEGDVDAVGSPAMAVYVVNAIRILLPEAIRRWVLGESKSK